LNDSLVVALRRAARDSRGENKGSFRVKKMSRSIPDIFFFFLQIFSLQQILSFPHNNSYITGIA